MASIVKIKRSAVQGKAPTTSDLEAGEIALNTRDGKLFSSDGTAVFEIGGNVHSISVGTGGLVIANGSITFPTTDGSSGQVLSTDGSGNITFQDVDAAADAGGFENSLLTSVPSGDLMEGGSGTETYVGQLGGSGQDPYGVSLADPNYSNMDPVRRFVTEDLGAI